ncbi:MAG TPA: 2-oxo acid dehydrogenase subunit E2 [Planctomycetota bacterium]|nr:2-oxo acid dehydrogenase subunit E2 [Planctomycetota bacterium]
MLTAIRVPALDSSTEKATLLRVLVSPGQQITKGTPVAEIETEKATFPVESPCAGRVERALVDPGSEVPVRAAILTLQTEDTGVELYTESGCGSQIQDAPAPTRSSTGYTCTQPRNVLFNTGTATPAIHVPPAMRYGGSTEERAEKFAARNVPISETIKLAGSGLRTQQRMTFSARNIPTSSVSMPLDISTLRERVQTYRAASKQLVNPTDVVLWAAARSLKDFPELKAYRDGEELRLYAKINLGIVYDIKGELSVPAVLDADTLSFADFSSDLRSLYKQLTAKSLPLERLGVATFVVSNLFGSGATHAHPIVNAGNSAVLLIGTPYQQPLLDDSGMRFAEHVNLVLGFDHSIVNGVRAAAFLKAVARLVGTLEL